jgi:xylulose-5-phosphate/fructose-6-phosphate phosphoketolase
VLTGGADSHGSSTNCVLSVADNCLRSANYANVVIADKQVHLQYLDINGAIEDCTKGAEIWNAKPCPVR